MNKQDVESYKNMIFIRQLYNTGIKQWKYTGLLLMRFVYTYLYISLSKNMYKIKIIAYI